MCLKTNGTRPTSASSAIRGRRYSTPSWRISGKDVGAPCPTHLPDAHRGQAGERIHAHEPRGQKVDAPHDIRRNATGSPPRIPRKMDTAMTYIRLAEQDNRKALAESVGKQKNAKTRANSIIATRSSIAVA